jgi:hypothetical protein
MTLAELAQKEEKIPNDQLDYMSKKLVYVFTFIDEGLRNW